MFKAGAIFKDTATVGHHVILLEVTEEDMRKHAMNCSSPGLYGFYRQWYGSDILSHRSYGKIEDLCGSLDWRFIGMSNEFTAEQVKALLG